MVLKIINFRETKLQQLLDIGYKYLQKKAKLNYKTKGDSHLQLAQDILYSPDGQIQLCGIEKILPINLIIWLHSLELVHRSQVNYVTLSRNCIRIKINFLLYFAIILFCFKSKFIKEICIPLKFLFLFSS